MKRWARGGWMLGLLLACAAAWSQPAQRLVQARRCTVTLEQAAAGPPVAQDGCWSWVALPDVGARPVVPGDAAAAATMSWYTLDWVAPGGRSAGSPLAVYVPRVISRPLQMWVLEEGRWRLRFDNQAGALEQWNRPLLIPLDPALAAQGSVHVALGVPTLHGRHQALSRVWIGPEAELRERHAWRMLQQQTAPVAICLVMVSLGVLALGVWAARGQERGYLYFAFACGAWSVRNLHLFINLPQGDAAFAWFWWMSNASVAWLMLATYLYAFCFDPRRLPRVQRLLVACVVAVSLVTMPGVLAAPLLALQGFNLAVALTVTSVLSLLAARGGGPELRAIVAALWVCLGLAVHDWLLVAQRISPEAVYLLPYGALLVLCSFLYAAQRRFRGAVAQAESASRVLAEQLAQRERELALRHEQLRAVEREQALLLERQRLMRDMHDGVGSHLIALLRLAEHGQASPAVLSEHVRNAIEELRLTIDSLEPLEHDLATLLSTLRRRVGRQLEGAGLTLRWSMADMPPLPWLEPAQALQVLRLVQEAMTNAVKHARARTLEVSALQVGQALEVCVADDGQGFEVSAAAGGHGLDSMRQRAQALGASLAVEASPGQGCRVRLQLPLQR